MWGKLLSFILLVASGVIAVRANWEGIHDPDLTTQIATICYSIFDPILLSFTVLTASSFRGGEVGKAWWYVVIGIFLYYAANQAYNYLVLTEQYATGSPIDVGWMLGFGFIAWAAVKTRNVMNWSLLTISKKQSTRMRGVLFFVLHEFNAWN